MDAFITVVGFTALLLSLRLGGTSTVSRRSSAVRNSTAFLIALVSAYVLSIAFDSVWGRIVGGFALTIIPILVGTFYGFGLYIEAGKLATRPVVGRLAYIIIGALATSAGLIGQKHNFFVGASLLTLSVVLPFHPDPKPAS
jgi:hypothetical protein